jgi:hypothetical protein
MNQMTQIGEQHNNLLLRIDEIKDDISNIQQTKVEKSFQEAWVNEIEQKVSAANKDHDAVDGQL